VEFPSLFGCGCQGSVAAPLERVLQHSFAVTQRSESNGVEKSVVFEISACRQRNPRPPFLVSFAKSSRGIYRESCRVDER
jgi:hypothetical protein